MGLERKKPGQQEIGSENNQKDKVFRRKKANTEIKILLNITGKEYRKKNRKETKRNKKAGEIARKNNKAQKGGWGKQLAKEKKVKRLTNLKKV